MNSKEASRILCKEIGDAYTGFKKLIINLINCFIGFLVLDFFLKALPYTNLDLPVSVESMRYILSSMILSRFGYGLIEVVFHILFLSLMGFISIFVRIWEYVEHKK
jgi:hypothetical protein